MKPIWIVDDDQSIRFVLEKALAREELPVRSFTNPRDVLAALEVDEPQVLVSDIRMPGGSGIDLLSKVKARHPGLPVIIMTAYSDLDSAVSAFQGGAFEYLPKPFDLPKAVELIRRAVEESVREEVLDDRVTQMPEMLGQAPARSWLRGRCTSTARVPTGLSLPSTRRPSRRICWSPSCSAMSAVPSPARRPCAEAA